MINIRINFIFYFSLNFFYRVTPSPYKLIQYECLKLNCNSITISEFINRITNYQLFISTHLNKISLQMKKYIEKISNFTLIKNPLIYKYELYHTLIQLYSLSFSNCLIIPITYKIMIYIIEYTIKMGMVIKCDNNILFVS